MEERIAALCAETIAAKGPLDVERINREFRKALEDHIREAKNSLGAQATALPILDSLVESSHQQVQSDIRTEPRVKQGES